MGGVWTLLGNDLDHRLLKLPDDAQVNQGARDRQLQTELLAHFTRQPEDRIDERRSVDGRCPDLHAPFHVIELISLKFVARGSSRALP